LVEMGICMEKVMVKDTSIDDNYFLRLISEINDGKKFFVIQKFKNISIKPLIQFFIILSLICFLLYQFMHITFLKPLFLLFFVIAFLIYIIEILLEELHPYFLYRNREYVSQNTYEIFVDQNVSSNSSIMGIFGLYSDTPINMTQIEIDTIEKIDDFDPRFPLDIKKSHFSKFVYISCSGDILEIERESIFAKDVSALASTSKFFRKVYTLIPEISPMQNENYVINNKYLLAGLIDDVIYPNKSWWRKNKDLIKQRGKMREELLS